MAYNATGTGDTAIMSNGIDFFQALEASGETSLLDTLRGGWGNDWDMWPASLAERTSRTRRALERLRTAEALAVWAELHSPGFWSPVRDSLEAGLISVWKYFEHGWDVTGGGPILSQMQADKESWTQDIENAVDGAIAAAETTVSPVCSRHPTRIGWRSSTRSASSAPMWPRSRCTGPGPYVVTDVQTGLEVPSQLIDDSGTYWLRFLAGGCAVSGLPGVPLRSGDADSWPDAATVTTGYEDHRERRATGWCSAPVGRSSTRLTRRRTLMWSWPERTG